jgi:hypothetical protein
MTGIRKLFLLPNLRKVLSVRLESLEKIRKDYGAG